MFAENTVFNQPVLFDTSRAESLSWMFEGCSSFNQDLSWDTRKVTDFSVFLSGATSFNGDLSSFDTSKAEDMVRPSLLRLYVLLCYPQRLPPQQQGWMFEYAESFDQDLSNFNTSLVNNMYAMFSGATSFQGRGLASWDTSRYVRIRCHS